MLELSVILFVLFLHLLFYKPSNNLACGLFGYVGEGTPMFEKIKLLGILNQHRGEDSCGIMYGNGEVDHFVGKFTDFLQKYDFDTAKMAEFKDKTIIGHVRARSTGAVSLDNCHPFVIKEEDKTKLVLAHNGTVNYYGTLLSKYDISVNGIGVDSKAMATIIAKDFKNTSVFGEYKGAGAFVWWYPNKKNTLYIFKGASKQYSNSLMEEERPLFYWEADGGLYYSSTESSLKIIGGNDETIKSFPINELLVISKGKIKSLEKFDRSKVDNVGVWYPWENRPTHTPTKKNSVVNHADYDWNSYSHGSCNVPALKPAKKKIILPTQSADTKLDLNQEPNYFDPGVHGGRIYWWRGRYYRTGHIINKATAASKTHCIEVISDSNGYIKGHREFDETTAKSYWFWNGIIISADKVKEVNTLSDQLQLYRNDATYGAVLNSLKVSAYTDDIVVSPEAWWGEAIKETEYYCGDYKPLFNSPFTYTFLTGKLIKIEGDATEYNKKDEGSTVDEPVQDKGDEILEQGMELIKDAAATGQQAANVMENAVAENAKDIYLDSIIDLLESAKQIEEQIQVNSIARTLWLFLVETAQKLDSTYKTTSLRNYVTVDSIRVREALKFSKEMQDSLLAKEKV